MQNPGQLFKANSRSHAENKAHSLHATFAPSEANTTFGALSLLNDETLSANESISKTVLSGTIVMVIPLIGAAECHFSTNSSQIVVPGEAFTYYSNKEHTISIKNLYEDSQINFLYISFIASIPSEVLLPKDFLIAQADFRVRNKFHKLFESFQNGLATRIGIFSNNAETTHNPNNKTNGTFAFVISGMFEIQGNLLKERDGIALWGESETAIKALSENAILLLIETPLTGFSPV